MCSRRRSPLVLVLLSEVDGGGFCVSLLVMTGLSELRDSNKLCDLLFARGSSMVKRDYRDKFALDPTLLLTLTSN